MDPSFSPLSAHLEPRCRATGEHLDKFEQLQTSGTASTNATAHARSGCSRWWRTDETRISSLRLASGKRAALKDILLLETRSNITQP